MEEEVLIQSMTEADYDAAVSLWSATTGIGLSAADERENIRRYLERNANLSLVAVKDGAMIGAVLCGHDGRRGYLHHLAVAASYRGKGIGRRLVAECVKRLADENIDRCHVFVFPDNEQGLAFWREVGFPKRNDILLCSHDIQR